MMEVLKMSGSTKNRRPAKRLKWPTIKTFHIYGQGAGLNRTGSGFAWIQFDTGKQHFERVDRVTKPEAEFMGLISVLEQMAEGSWAHIWLSSPFVRDLFTYSLPGDEPRINALLTEASDLEVAKNLRVETLSIPGQRNLAADLFDVEMWKHSVRELRQNNVFASTLRGVRTQEFALCKAVARLNKRLQRATTVREIACELNWQDPVVYKYLRSAVRNGLLNYEEGTREKMLSG
jgi:hypothetical protein